MFGPSITFRRLYERGPTACSLAVDRSGVALGPDIVLVEATRGGYRVAAAGQLSRIGSELALGDAAIARLPLVLAQIADELAPGNLAKAQLLALGIPLPTLNAIQLDRLAKLAHVAKAGFNQMNPAAMANGRGTASRLPMPRRQPRARPVPRWGWAQRLSVPAPRRSVQTSRRYWSGLRRSQGVLPRSPSASSSCRSIAATSPKARSPIWPISSTATTRDNSPCPCGMKMAMSLSSKASRSPTGYTAVSMAKSLAAIRARGSSSTRSQYRHSPRRPWQAPHSARNTKGSFAPTRRPLRNPSRVCAPIQAATAVKTCRSPPVCTNRVSAVCRRIGGSKSMARGSTVAIS